MLRLFAGNTKWSMKYDFFIGVPTTFASERVEEASLHAYFSAVISDVKRLKLIRHHGCLIKKKFNSIQSFERNSLVS